MPITASQWSMSVVRGESDGGIFGRSSLGNAILDESNYSKMQTLPNSEVLLPYVYVADDAFPLQPNLMKPFGRSDLDYNKSVFNYRLSRSRRIVENAFGIIVARWRILRKPMEVQPENAVAVVQAILILHNFLRKSDGISTSTDNYFSTNLVDQESESGLIVPGEWRSMSSAFQNLRIQGSKNFTTTAATVRDEFKNYFVSAAGQVPWQWHVVNRGRLNPI